VTSASLTGWPERVVPSGFTTDPMPPIGLSFLATPFSEAKAGPDGWIAASGVVRR
jgi:Asp-tRNA(Asn)/Glu-tRNA(Gln) amidotransferase A subunit family amidase